MQIVHYPHPALSWKSKSIQEINASLRAIVEEMFELMYEHKGVGLAANQVALPYRMFIMNPAGDPDVTEEEAVFINPEILKRNGSVVDEEGCLSLPEVYGNVCRAEEIIVEAFNLKGECFEFKLKDLPARVVQHEFDHIDGVMFIDRMSKEDRFEIEGEVENFMTHFKRQQEKGEFPSDQEIQKQLKNLEP
ncbi:Peptide deformylase [hydrothermal vent metagenome]|uniref:Peptide deformylase n=1 Tax=hydrothermal vent metagenome TaxID=652676 RepID=A0A3B1DZ59_9ZZZZ